MGRRFVSWEAGLAGFAERPVLGWGPANYMAPFGRYVGASGADLPTNDHAHNVLIEVAATKGLAGFAAYLAIWGLTFAVVLRAARGAEPREQAFALFAGAALLGQFVQSQALFGTASSALQYTLLMAVAVGLEVSTRPPDGGPRMPVAVAPSVSPRPPARRPRDRRGGLVRLGSGLQPGHSRGRRRALPGGDVGAGPLHGRAAAGGGRVRSARQRPAADSCSRTSPPTGGCSAPPGPTGKPPRRSRPSR